MADSFRQIPTEIFHALMRAGLSGACYQIILTIIDRTLGFVEKDGITRRKKTPISLTHFMNVTRLSRSGVNKAIKQVEKARIIIPDRKGNKKTAYALNMNTSEWASEQTLTREIGNGCTPVWTTDVHQSSTLPTNGTKATKETSKEIYIKKEDVPSKEGIVVDSIKDVIDDVISAISAKQGYLFPYPDREVKATKRALELGYTKEDMLGCYDFLKGYAFWSEKPISMNTILMNLGEYKKAVSPEEKRGYTVEDLLSSREEEENTLVECSAE